MKTLLKPILAVITLLVVPAMVMGQKQTRKAVENAFNTGQYEVYTTRDSYKYSDYVNPHEEYFFTVKNCEIEWSDFQAYFKSNPQLVASDITTETRLKYGAEVTFVKSFRFHNDHKKLSSLEFGLQIENQNTKLKLPSFTNVKEAEGFYQKYVKNSSKHAKKYKEQFCEVFTNYCKSNPDELKKFCDASPYDNVEILKELDVRSLLANADRKYDYIYYCSANNGYFFDSKGDFHYQGDIRNGMPNGHGKNNGWEGTFVDGKKVGTFTLSTSANHYDWSDTGVGGVGGNDWFFFKRTGTCVNDKWDGEVVLEVTHQNSGTLSDVEIIRTVDLSKKNLCRIVCQKIFVKNENWQSKEKGSEKTVWLPMRIWLITL